MAAGSPLDDVPYIYPLLCRLKRRTLLRRGRKNCAAVFFAPPDMLQ